MQVNIKAIFEKKRNILLFLLFMLGAYAFVQSVLTRGETQYVAENVDIPAINEARIEEGSDIIAPQVLGDRMLDEDGVFAEETKKLIKTLAQKTIPKQDEQPKIEAVPTETPAIVLGYKEGFNEAWDPCDNLELAQAFGFNTTNCNLVEEPADNSGSLVINTPSGGGGGGGSGAVVVEPIILPEEENPVEPVEPVEEEVVYASSTEVLLDSWIIGGQEVIGQVGSEPMSFTETSYKSGTLLEVTDPYTFQGISFKTSQPIGQIMVYTFHDHWITWDLNYPGAQEALDAWVLQDKDTVVVKVISEDFLTTNWYKAKLFDTNTGHSMPAFLERFEVGGIDVLPLTGLAMDYPYLNIVDFGATLLQEDFTSFKGIDVLVNDWDNFSEAKVFVYHGYWATWDLLYGGAIADLANVPLYEGDMIILKLKDKENHTFWYRVNLVVGTPEIIPEEETDVSPMILSSDSSLSSLVVGGQEAIGLPGVNIGDTWYSSSTGAVLIVNNLDDFIGVIPQASDPASTVQVRIYRDYWITWEYDLGLDLVAKEHILANDRIVIEVTAPDGTKTYYQVQVTLKTQVENHPVQKSPESLSAEDIVKPEPVEELELKVIKEEETNTEAATAERGPATGGTEISKETEVVVEDLSTDSVKTE